MALMPALAASIGYVIERRGYAEHERRYAHMAHLFDWALGELTGKVVPDKAQTLEILREVGREALAENGDWLILHRERPLRPPTGG